MFRSNSSTSLNSYQLKQAIDSKMLFNSKKSLRHRRLLCFVVTWRTATHETKKFIEMDFISLSVYRIPKFTGSKYKLQQMEK